MARAVPVGQALHNSSPLPVPVIADSLSLISSHCTRPACETGAREERKRKEHTKFDPMSSSTRCTQGSTAEAKIGKGNVQNE